jgi:hypothetical protein
MGPLFISLLFPASQSESKKGAEPRSRELLPDKDFKKTSYERCVGLCVNFYHLMLVTPRPLLAFLVAIFDSMLL